MNEQNKISSYFASPYFAGAMLFFAFVTAYFGNSILFGYLIFITLLSISAHLWGRFSSHGIAVDINAKSYRVYPDQDIEMEFTLKNDKLLPLMWLEWVQPYPPNHCLDVPEDFEVCDIKNPANGDVIGHVLGRRFSFIKWYSTMTWTSVFHASRRGVYIPQVVGTYTGDGFGLSVHKREFELPSPPVFVIYPKLVEVMTDSFFKNAWSASTGPHGVIEDVTVLKGIRDYERNDSFKRINWRIAARSDELYVNVYDTISPRSVYFFIDTATFCGVSDDNAEFEETLSVVGSLITELFSQDMSVAVYLPNMADGREHSVPLENTSADECLLALALCDCDDGEAQFSRQCMASLLASQSGNVYYICHDATSARFSSVLDDAGITRYSIISYAEPDGDTVQAIDTSEVSVRKVADFKKG